MTDSYDQAPEFIAMDDAIRAYMQSLDPEHIVTGWAVAASAMPIELPEHLASSYSLRVTSPSAQHYHHTLGLLCDAYQQTLNPSSEDEA